MNLKSKVVILLRLKENKSTIPILIILSILGLFVVNLLINWPIRLKALAFSDDLINWNFFDIYRNNFFRFIFNTYANKFRPVFNSVFFSLFYLFGYKTWLFGVFNILFSFLVGTILFLLFRKISKNIIVSFCLSVAFIFSRFAYYDITQALGLMEAMALLFSTITIYLLWCYLNTEKIKYFWMSLVVFTLLIFTHERFITILGVYFVLFLILGLKKKNILLFLISTVPVIFSFFLKIFILKIRALDGTGGTNILYTFNIFEFVQTFLSGWFYLFGVNAGPTYLNGISSEGVPLNINNLILIGNICLFLLAVIFGLSVMKSKKILFKKYFRNFILFFTFIFVTLLAGSVTFRMEMRWLYVPFVGLLFLLAYISGIIIKKRILIMPFILVFLVWFGVYINREIFYRSYYKNIYFWDSFKLGNSLFETFINKYGDDFWNHKFYILCSEKPSDYMISCTNNNDFNLFFSQYRNNNTEANVYLIDNISEIIDKSDLTICFYDQQNNEFIEMYINNNLKNTILRDGWYDWDSNKVSIWTNKKANAWFRTGSKGKFVFQGFIPKYNLPNIVSFYINNKLVKKININESNIYFEMKVPKNEILDLMIDVENTKSLKKNGLGSDIRELGILVYKIEFE